MRRIFFHTSAYVALTDTSDQFHAHAARLAERIIAGWLPRITTNYVLAEAYTRIRRKPSTRAVRLSSPSKPQAEGLVTPQRCGSAIASAGTWLESD